MALSLSLSLLQATRKTARQAKKEANFPMRRYAVRA